MNDLKSSFHRLLNVPGFKLLAVLTLALGLAGSTVIFTVFNGLLLPFGDKVVARLQGI